ncbi:MAG: MATE family efflux transporter, partial [Prevotella sp.]|nr:MATE family efflux transporter [Prevotella sp.]
MRFNHRDKEILHLAIPSIISNITVPLLGLVDLAIVGHISNETLLAAISVGSMIFNVIYWIFGFLRMGTSGLTSQALGRRDLR